MKTLTNAGVSLFLLVWVCTAHAIEMAGTHLFDAKIVCTDVWKRPTTDIEVKRVERIEQTREVVEGVVVPSFVVYNEDQTERMRYTWQRTEICSLEKFTLDETTD